MRRPSTRNYRQWGYIGFNGGGSVTSRVPHGEPYAGNLHVRFDEGAGVPDNKGRPALLYTLPYMFLLYMLDGGEREVTGSAAGCVADLVYYAAEGERLWDL